MKTIKHFFAGVAAMIILGTLLPLFFLAALVERLERKNEPHSNPN